jgi:hypothetical protein
MGKLFSDFASENSELYQFGECLGKKLSTTLLYGSAVYQQLP